jgi:hypothetical protein
MDLLLQVWVVTGNSWGGFGVDVKLGALQAVAHMPLTGTCSNAASVSTVNQYSPAHGVDQHVLPQRQCVS